MGFSPIKQKKCKGGSPAIQETKRPGQTRVCRRSMVRDHAGRVETLMEKPTVIGGEETSRRRTMTEGCNTVTGVGAQRAHEVKKRREIKGESREKSGRYRRV